MHGSLWAQTELTVYVKNKSVYTEVLHGTKCATDSLEIDNSE